MLEKVNFDEARQSQLPFIELLLNMGYTYISAEESLRQRGGDTSNFILSDIAAEKLMEINGYEVGGTEYKFSEKDVRDAIDELEHIQYEGLIDTAQKIYNTIMPTSGGKTIKVNHGGKKVSKNFRFIDFQTAKVILWRRSTLNKYPFLSALNPIMCESVKTAWDHIKFMDYSSLELMDATSKLLVERGAR
jgi:hypothetical protein